MEFEQTDSAAARFDAGNRLRAGVTAAIATRDLAHWQRVLAEHDVPFSPVHGAHEVFTEPHFVARGAVSQFTDAVTGKRISAAAFPGGLYRGAHGAAPTLDQHGAALRAELTRAQESTQQVTQSHASTATGE
jgi:crotonobetainyl-CoA:carnitine CoA-transferase CaiB-like acyl-CoA transferase